MMRYEIDVCLHDDIEVDVCNRFLAERIFGIWTNRKNRYDD